jgi:hypothetical protein
MALKPHFSQSVPEETARVARAAFPHGTLYLAFRDALGTIFRDEDFAALFPACGQPTRLPGASPWSPPCSSMSRWRTAKRPRLSARVLIGSTYSAWSETIQGSIFLCSVSSGTACSPAARKPCCWTHGSSAAGPSGSSRHAGNGGRTPPMPWPPSMSSLGWNESPRPSERRSSSWPPWCPTGCKGWCPWNGMRAMTSGSMTPACPGTMPHARPMPRRSERTRSTSLTPWGILRLRRRRRSYRASRHCAVPGSWAERVDATGTSYIQVRFRQQDCRACGTRALCTQATQAARTLKLQPQAEFEALQAARTWYSSAEGRRHYQRRAGIEGTLSQGIRSFGLRCARYRGLAKTHFQHIATAAAVNVDRLVSWLDERPRAKTRTSHFVALAPV